MVLNTNNIDQLKQKLEQLFNETINDSLLPPAMPKDKYIQDQINVITMPWTLYFLRYDPIPALEKVKCPVLALNGAKDLQVPAKENLQAIEKALTKAKNKHFLIKELPELNHLFQQCNTGAPSEYASIEESFSPIALTEISNWIKLQLR